MKIGLLILSFVFALIVSAHEMSLRISDAGADVNLNVTGSEGVHQIQNKADLSAADWSPVAGLTTETNITRPKNAPRGFFRAAAAPAHDVTIFTNALMMIDSGRQIFRYDTFASEKFWGDALRLHEAVAGTNNGGVGPGVSPRLALHLRNGVLMVAYSPR